AAPTARALRALIGLLPRGGRALGRRAPGARLRLRLRRREAAERALQVVEDEPGRGSRAGRGRDQALLVADDEDAAVAERRVQLDELLLPLRIGLAVELERRARDAAGLLVVDRRGLHGPLPVEHDGDLDLGRDLGQMSERIGGRRHALDANRHILRADAVAAPAARQVLRRPRPSPRGHDRLLRAALIRPAALPDDLIAVAGRKARRVELPGDRAQARVPGQLDLDHRPRGAGDPEPRDRARDPWRGRAALDVALALQRARVRLQHRLRAAEPLLPAREAARGRADADLAGDALLRAAGRLVRLRPAQALRGLGRRQLVCGVRAVGGRLDGLGVRLPGRDLLPADERRALLRRRAARSGRRSRAAGGELPGAAGLRALLGQRGGAEGPRRAGSVARLAVRDGERDRLRRRGELALRAEAPPSERRRARSRRARVERPNSDCHCVCPRRFWAARARWELRRFQSLPSSATVALSPPGTKTGSYPNPSDPRGSSAIRPSSTPEPRSSSPPGPINTSSQT